MQISRKEIDPLNSIITIKLEKKDFSSKVDDVLKNYRKKANIPGFRKGFVPMGLVKKQYQNAVTAEEVNKILQDKLNNFLKDEKIDILGSPLPVVKEDLDWKSETLEFAFELGISPKFKINLDSKKKVIHFKIFADEKMIDDQLNNIQKQYGKMVSKNEIKESFEISALFQSDENTIKTSSNFLLQDIKGNKNKELIKAAKPGDKINLKIKNLFKDPLKAKQILSLNDTDLSKLDGEILIEIKEVNERILSELNQELFDKIYEPGSVKSKKEMKIKIAEGIEKQLEQQSDQKLLNDVTEYLINNTKFNLPEKFLMKWMETAGENKLSKEDAEAEFKKSEKGLRYQLIESKIIENNKIKIDLDQIKVFSKDLIKTQMMQYGQMNPEEKELESISQRILSNKDEVKRISDQLLSQKLITLFKSELKFKTKKVSYEKFVEMAYGKK